MVDKLLGKRDVEEFRRMIWKKQITRRASESKRVACANSEGDFTQEGPMVSVPSSSLEAEVRPEGPVYIDMESMTRELYISGNQCKTVG